MLSQLQSVRGFAYRSAGDVCLSQGRYWSFVCENGVWPVLASSWRIFRYPTSSCQMLTEDTFLQRCRLYTRRLCPVPTSHHSSSNFFVHPDLHASSHVFVRCDTVRKALEQPYQGPFDVVHRNENFFNKRHSTVSIDQLKPALPDVSSESSLSRAAESKCQKVSKQPVTRSGRRVWLVKPYQAY
ncbi:hypothetical protein AVEN_218002-1 [Araneus ventricosus]|uniref:Uncharacterized protein n=1 Tax=Araneus ventricosus TaxID=182803 RepID=A0A4Y2KFQ8_ARAVE|nr:hypothetical protein AVEN_218002-1 [Araneus ventricosus]